MRTIFVTSFHNLISRNILAAPFFDLLKKEPDLRIVLLVPVGKRAFFEQEYGGGNVIVEEIKRKLTRIDSFLGDFALSALRTRSTAIRRRHRMGVFWYTRYLFFWAPLVRRWYQHIYSVLTPRNTFGEALDRYRPDLVFATDIFSLDSRLLLEVKDRHIPTIGMVRSWDNLTTKGPIPVIPDTLAVNNSILKHESMQLHGIAEQKIRVVGIPHYDRYRPAEPRDTSAFRNKMGIAADERIVVFSPQGDHFFRRRRNTFDRDMIELIASCLSPKTLLLVRFMPLDGSNLDGLRLPAGVRVVFDRPGTQIADNPAFFARNELSRADDEHLIDTLVSAALVVSVGTTLAIDGAFFDKPQLLIGFDSYDRQIVHRSVIDAHEYDHMQHLINSGGVAVAYNAKELRSFVMASIEHPEQYAAGRRNLVRQQCYATDGASSERLLAVIREVLYKSTV